LTIQLTAAAERRSKQMERDTSENCTTKEPYAAAPEEKPVAPAAPGSPNDANTSDADATRMPPEIRAILGPPPVVAGEDRGVYYQLLNMVIEEWDPQGHRQWSLVKQIADSEWEAIRFRQARGWVFNAAIARSIFKQIVDHFCQQELLEMEKRQEPFLRMEDPSIERKFGQWGFLQWRRKAFAAVLGDRAAIKQVEEKIGRGRVVMDACAAGEFETCITPQLQIDRLFQSSLDSRDSAYDQLERLPLKRSTRQTSPEMIQSRRLEAQAAPTAPQNLGVLPEPAQTDLTASPQADLPTAGDCVSVSVHAPSADSSDASSKDSEGNQSS
jgi:hypothetical protein